MSAPPLKRPVLTCLNKQRHPDEFVARAAAMHSLERPDCDVDRLWVYRCPLCRGFHLSSRPQGRGHMVTVTNPVHTKTLNTQRN